MSGLVLSDFGERRLLEEVIPKYADGTGDDCAVLSVGAGYLVATTDPAPKPAASVIAGDSDPYWIGWLLVTINASDIAASGAKPAIFLAAFDLPRDWPVESLERLMSGVKDSCVANDLKYAGGNIREAEKVNALGTAIGFCAREPLGRTGARSGTKVYVFGKSGDFWSDVVRHRSGETIDKDKSPLFRPVSQAGVIHDLHTHDLLTCAMDTSDGLAPTLEELAAKNSLGIKIDLEKVRKNSQHLTAEERAERLWLGWGDWTVVAGVEAESVEALNGLIAKQGYTAFEIGEFTSLSEGVVLKDGAQEMKMGRLESERFAKDSWFHLGVEAYENLLRELPLP